MLTAVIGPKDPFADAIRLRRDFQQSPRGGSNPDQSIAAGVQGGVDQFGAGVSFRAA